MADWNALPAELWHRILKISIGVTNSVGVDGDDINRASELWKTCKVIDSALTGKVSCDLWAKIECDQRIQTTDFLVRVAGYVKHLHIKDMHKRKAGLDFLSGCCRLKSVKLSEWPHDVNDFAAGQHAWQKALSTLHTGPSGIDSILWHLVQMFVVACSHLAVGVHKSFHHFAETLRVMSLHQPYTPISSAPTTLTQLHILGSPSWGLPQAFNCAVLVRHLRVLNLFDQAFQAQDLAEFSPSQFKSVLPQLQKLKLSEICLDGLNPFAQLEQADGLVLDLVLRCSAGMLDNTASLQQLAGIMPNSVCLKDVVHISASLFAAMAVQRHFSLHAAQSSTMNAISQTPRCQALKLNLLPGVQVDWTCLFQHASYVDLYGCVHIYNFNSLPSKPSWKFVMWRYSAWTLHWKARDLLKAGIYKGFYEDKYEDQTACQHSNMIMGSSDVVNVQSFGYSVWSVRLTATMV